MKQDVENRLAKEASPYLKQHASNPVDWHPWGEEALRLAREQNKPLLVSIGYSSCHWCHVMEHESFANPDIAALMNRYFVNIKIDREERPDLDEIYMNAVQALTGRGGWPLNVFLTPDLKPFFGGTYFPPDRRYPNMPSWPEIIRSLGELFHTDPERIQNNANELYNHVKTLSFLPEAKQNDWQQAFAAVTKLKEQLLRSFDPVYGGFGTAPKFPHAEDIRFLSGLAQRQNDEAAKNAATFTLEKMAHGGIYDQLAGGFHRYSTDEKWLVPHFEKMLYDNALLLPAYAEAGVLFKNDYFVSICEEIVQYLQSEMCFGSNAFYSAQDADTENEEGKFFVWEKSELLSLLDTSDKLYPVLESYFGFDGEPNFEGKAYVLHVHRSLDVVAQDLGLSLEEARERLQKACELLKQQRDKRERPFTDKKIIAAWNMMMISGLCEAGRLLQKADWVDLAQKAMDFLETNLKQGDALLRISAAALEGAGRSNSKEGFLEDHAYYVQALLDLHLATQDAVYLNKAIAAQKFLDAEFSDAEECGYFFTKANQKDVLVRTRSAFDGATPSALAIAVGNLWRLSSLTGLPAYKTRLERIFSHYAAAMNQSPRAFAKLLQIVELYQNQNEQIIVVGKSSEANWQEMKNILVSVPTRYLNLLMVDLDKPEASWKSWPSLDGKLGVTTCSAFICQDFACQAPITLPKVVAEYLSDR
ncbi:MAG: thioredoxin domain-containing protein [Deltaproteobacteria bacterium]|nr:thioredoxin domain-containing protein [Deltaproteobacteria bacterium]